MTGIYKISNKDNGKVYIGKSKDIMQRWSAHGGLGQMIKNRLFLINLHWLITLE